MSYIVGEDGTIEAILGGVKTNRPTGQVILDKVRQLQASSKPPQRGVVR